MNEIIQRVSELEALVATISQILTAQARFDEEQDAAARDRHSSAEAMNARLTQIEERFVALRDALAEG